ncbi:MAG: glucosaminidase domain-containing protein [Bacteroidales bacterium]|jgi:hypothetical protein|nr:glucosaminidase domain-containing protein [Bacteroidales bacterium]
MIKSFGIFACGLVFAGTPAASAQKITAAKYIDTYRELAVSEMKRSGIPASITLAQGILESGSGNSDLAVRSNNHFGIKCHDWDGEKAFHDDDLKKECFRSYGSAEESFLDHTDFLMSRSRYAFLFNYRPTDYKSWAKGLRKAGYATDPRYPQRLIELIERHKLHLYDSGVSMAKAEERTPVAVASGGKTGAPKPSIDNFSVNIERYPVMENNHTEYITAREGDTYASLTKERKMMLWQLPRYNERPLSTTLREGETVYLQPKRRRAERGKDTHTLAEGETMYDVSQKYAVRLSRLYSMNRMEEGTEAAAGVQLNLRKRK